MPTSALNTYTMGGLQPINNPEHAYETQENVNLIASTTFVAGTVLGRVTATGKYAAYASGSSDGSQIPQGLLQYGCTTDSSGNIIADDRGFPQSATPMYTQGEFLCSELTGLDANAVTAFNRAGLVGSLTTGKLIIGG